MKIKNIIVCILVLLTNLVNVGVDLTDYEKLKINNVASIKLDILYKGKNVGKVVLTVK